MQRSDLVLILLAALALVATAAGALGSDRWTGEHTVTFVTATGDLAAQGPADADGGGAHFNWSVPDNATSALLHVTVTFTGQSVRGGSATIGVRVTMPDGRAGNDTTAAMTIPSGSSAPVTMTLDVPVRWSMEPRPVRDVEGSEPRGVHWAKALEVVVSAARPTDAPLASYSFTASINGTVDVYRAA